MIESRPTILSRLPRGAWVVVIRLRSMGDTVLATPALALLKQSRPDLRMAVVLEPAWTRLLESNPDVDQILTVARDRRWQALRAIRRLEPALCLNFHGGPTSAWMTLLSGARFRAGFGHFPHQWIYNVRIPRAQEILGVATDAPVHTAEHLASAMFYLGAERREIPAARLSAEAARRERPYAVLHLGAAEASKQWPAERFIEVARWVTREGLEPLLVAGPGEGELVRGMKEFPAFANLSLQDMMALIRGAELFIGNDSGPAHVAAAFGLPCVVIFGSSNAKVWHPWRTRHRVLEPMSEDARGITGVTVEAVQEAAAALLGERARPEAPAASVSQA